MRDLRQSNVDWLGKIPQDWDIHKLKHLVSISKRIAGKEGLDVLSVTQRGIRIKDIESNEGQLAANYSGYQLVYPGDFIMNQMDLVTGWVDRATQWGVTSPDYRVFSIVGNRVSADFLRYVMQCCYMNRVFFGLGHGVSDKGRWRLATRAFLNFEVPIPSTDEQEAIVAYLDQKIYEWDDLEQAIRAQIDVLEAYKRSVIFDAVTKGFDASKELRPSGVPWIPQIPDGWSVNRGKYVLMPISRPTLSDDEVITCFRDGEVTLRRNRREEGFTVSEKEFGYQGIEPGDLVVHGMDGFAGAIGISDSRGKGSPVLNILDSDQNKRFLMYLLRCYAYIGVFLATATGIRVRSVDIRWSKIAELPLILPPRDVQDHVVAFLDDRIKRVDHAIEAKSRQLDLIEDYKKSLVYEMVTGKREVPVR